jgi:hypothetical protein
MTGSACFALYQQMPEKEVYKVNTKCHECYNQVPYSVISHAYPGAILSLP